MRRNCSLMVPERIYQTTFMTPSPMSFCLSWYQVCIKCMNYILCLFYRNHKIFKKLGATSALLNDQHDG